MVYQTLTVIAGSIIVLLAGLSPGTGSRTDASVA